MAAILALAVLTALVTGAMLLSGTEQAISRNHAASVEAGHVARAGLSQYLASYGGGTPPASATYAYGDDTAYVSADTMIAVDDDGHQYVFQVTSRGVLIDPEAGGDRTERTVHQLALYDSGVLRSPGAMASASGASVGGGGGVEIDGFDDCGVQDNAGVAVPPGGTYSEQGNPNVTGLPPVDSTRAATPLLEYTRVDSALWDQMLAGELGIRDYTVPPDGWPSLSTTPPFSSWPTIYVDADDYSLNQSNSGHGMIVARGDLEVGGSFEWYGLILVGGRFEGSGTRDIFGAVISGYNHYRGASILPADVGGSQGVVYSSCYVASASSGALERLMEEPGTVAESF